MAEELLHCLQVSGHVGHSLTCGVAGVGCFAIFEDAPYGRGNMWPVWCPDCRPKNGVRNPARDQARARARWLRRLQV